MIPSALTPQEWLEGEFASHYGHVVTSMEIDYKGRVFAHSERDGDDTAIVILNEAADAGVVLPKIIALANAALPDTDPRKITWAMVDGLRHGDVHDGQCRTTWEYPEPCDCTVPTRLNALADALASYLAPREAVDAAPCAHDGAMAFGTPSAGRCEKCGAWIVAAAKDTAPVITLKRETVFGSMSVIEAEAIFECPACREAGRYASNGALFTVTTAEAALKMRIPGGLQWQGAPCHGCGVTYTVERTETPEEATP